MSDDPKALRSALKSVQLLAARRLSNKVRPASDADREAWQHVVRICAEVGVKPEILREIVAPSSPDEYMRGTVRRKR